MGAKSEFGEIYSLMGDLNYYVSHSYEDALEYYMKGEENYYRTPEILYRKGFVHYLNGRNQRALLDFYDANEILRDNISLRYAISNTLYKRKDYYAAGGYLQSLKDELESRYRNLSRINLEDQPDQKILIKNLYRVYNNLGVTLVQIAGRTGDKDLRGQSQVYFTKAMELYDNMQRSPETGSHEIDPLTGKKRETKSLPYINSLQLLYPEPGKELLIFQDIPRDTDDSDFGVASSN